MIDAFCLLMKSTRSVLAGSKTAAAGTLPWGTPATPLVMQSWGLAYHPVQTYPWGVSGTGEYAELTGAWAADGGYIAAVPSRPTGNVRAAGHP